MRAQGKSRGSNFDELCRSKRVEGGYRNSAVLPDGAFHESEGSYWGLAGGKKGLKAKLYQHHRTSRQLLALETLPHIVHYQLWEQTFDIVRRNTTNNVIFAFPFAKRKQLRTIYESF